MGLRDASASKKDYDSLSGDDNGPNRFVFFIGPIYLFKLSQCELNISMRHPGKVLSWYQTEIKLTLSDSEYISH